MRYAFMVAALVAIGLAAGLSIGLRASATSKEVVKAAVAPASSGRATPATQSMSVFSGRPVEALPGTVQRIADQLSSPPPYVPAAQQSGQLGNAYVALSGFGSRDQTAFVFPTSTGQACYVLTGGDAGCVGSFDRVPAQVALYLNVPGTVGSAPIELGGLVPDDVVKIDVVVNATPHRATLGTNFFYYEDQDSSAWPSSLLVTYQDGTVQSVDIPSANGQ